MEFLAVEARLKLAEVVILTSILHNSEGFQQHKEKEIAELERIQHTVLTGMLELPESTPYYPLLMETGWWTMSARLAYRKLMLYQNIVTSDKKRVIKKIVQVQKEESRTTTWYNSVERLMKRFGINMDAETSLKSKWKKEVKEKIRIEMEKEIRTKCREMTKGRTVKSDEYRRKDYLGSMSLKEVKKTIKVRTHMSKLPANYKEGGEGICLLCDNNKGSTEHYFECMYTAQLVKGWGV